LVAALGRQADYLVTGDADLLVLNGDFHLDDLQIVTTRTTKMLRRLGRKSATLFRVPLLRVVKPL